MYSFTLLKLNMQFPKHYPDIPKWKWDKIEKKLKPIPKISQKKKERIKKEWSEADLFREIWWERSHNCEICWKFIPEPRPECFSHILSKGRYPALRYNKRNIVLCCQILCHKENDRRNAWNDIELIKKILW